MANYRDLLEQAGARYGVPEGLMTALGAKESSYNPAAVSSAGAVALTQVMPGTWRDMGYTDEQMQNPEYQADAHRFQRQHHTSNRKQQPHRRILPEKDLSLSPSPRPIQGHYSQFCRL